MALALGLAAALRAETAPGAKTPATVSTSESLTFRMSDGLNIFGEYRAPTKKTAPVLVMLHGLGSHHDEYNPLMDAASRRGWGSLAIDLRGHGLSQKRGNETVSYKDPIYGQDGRFWSGMIQDLREVVHGLEDQKGVLQKDMVLIGASVGANICLNAAERLKGIPAVVLLSPGVNYVGIGTEDVVSRWTRPLLMVAARPDANSYQSVQRLVSEAPQETHITTFLFDGPGPHGPHGAQLFDGKLEEKILDWIGGAVQKSKAAEQDPIAPDSDASTPQQSR